MYAAKLPGCIVDDVIDVVDDHLQYFSRGLDYFQIFLKIFSTIFRGGVNALPPTLSRSNRN